MGIFGLIELKQMIRRSPLDYGFERRSLMFGLIGVAMGMVCVIANRKDRKLRDWIPLAISLWITIVWSLICTTL